MSPWQRILSTAAMVIVCLGLPAASGAGEARQPSRQDAAQAGQPPAVATRPRLSKADLPALKRCDRAQVFAALGIFHGPPDAKLPINVYLDGLENYDCRGTPSDPGVIKREVRAFLDRELPGFGELFRMLSWKEIGPAAMLSRAAGGIAAGRPVFCVPGSTDAVKLAMESLILPELGHIIGELRR